MASIIEAGGKQLMVGLDWSLHENAKAMREARREAGSRVLHIVSGGDDGFLLGISDTAQPKGALIGAMAVGAVFPDSVVCHGLEDGTYWVCGLLYGAPLPGSDRVVAEDEAQEVVASLMSGHPTARLVGTISGAVATINDVVGQVPARKIKQMRLRRSGVTPGMVVLFTLGPLLALGALVGMQAYKKHVAEKEMEAAIAREAEAQRARAQSQIAAAAAARSEQELAMRDALAAGVMAAEQIDAWLRYIRALPTAHGGYRLDVVRCHGQAPAATTCDMEWRGNDRPGQRPSPFTALSLPGTPEATIDSDPSALAARVKSSQKLDPLPTAAFAPDAPSVVFTVVERMRDLGIDLRATAPSPVTVPAPVPPGANPKDPPPPPIVVARKGGWSVASLPLLHAMAMSDVLRSTSWRVKSIRAEGLSDGRLRISAEGEYVLPP